MDIASPLQLLGGLSPAAFMKRHWQRRPLLIRQAMPAAQAPLSRSALFALAASEDVESRLVERSVGDGGGSDSGSADEKSEGRNIGSAARSASAAGWRLRHGPFTRRALPPLSRPGWTLLVQGVDQHVDAAHTLLASFRFAPDARLDDLMLSFATDGGGVGPHVDSYDVFLLQLQGRRRWRIGPVVDAGLRRGLPLKILANFEPHDDWVLEPGDMLYLPPNWAHDGVAQGDCITASIGFRAAARGEVAAQVLQRLLDGEAAAADASADATSGATTHATAAADELALTAAPKRGRAGLLYRDAGQPATPHPARIPLPLARFAADAVARLLAQPHTLDRALGEWLSEPPPHVWYDEPASLHRDAGLRLDRRTRMLYDERHLFVNGESFRASGSDARLLRRLADQRRLAAADVQRFSASAWAQMQAWAADGWLVPDETVPPGEVDAALHSNRRSRSNRGPKTVANT